MAAKARALLGAFRQVASATFSWDVGSTATLVQATTTVAAPGVKPGDVVIVGAVTPTSGFTYDGYVSANGVITLRAHNVTAGTVDPAAITGTAIALRVN